MRILMLLIWIINLMHVSCQFLKSPRHHSREPRNSATPGNKSWIEFETEKERKTGKMSDSPSPSTSKTETPGATGMGAGKEENKGKFTVHSICLSTKWTNWNQYKLKYRIVHPTVYRGRHGDDVRRAWGGGCPGGRRQRSPRPRRPQELQLHDRRQVLFYQMLNRALNEWLEGIWAVKL